ncbi:hypothetical protein [Streptomyces himalayensis]|nr:hypothetical protein [Streptomyces himalayensis]
MGFFEAKRSAVSKDEAPTVQQVTGWLTRHRENLNSGQQLRLSAS